MSAEDERAYWQKIYDKAPAGSSRRLCAAAQLARLTGKPAAESKPTAKRSAK